MWPGEEGREGGSTPTTISTEGDTDRSAECSKGGAIDSADKWLRPVRALFDKEASEVLWSCTLGVEGVPYGEGGGVSQELYIDVSDLLESDMSLDGSSESDLLEC